MAVYTEVTADSLDKWLGEHYSSLQHSMCEPISEGIENTNYLLRLEDGRRLVLTIFEVWDRPMVVNYAELCSHLSGRGMPVPAPLRTAAGELVASYADKPAALLPFREGRANMSPQPEHCRIMGRLAAQLHRRVSGFGRHWENPRGRTWWKRALELLQPKISEALHAQLAQEAHFLSEQYPDGVPGGICHCDLFKNNVLWVDSHNISAVIDFYFGGHDAFIFDLAVCANDWCVGPSQEHDGELLAALLDGYQSVRVLSPHERRGFEVAMRAAALRFWLSRLCDIHYPRAAKILTPHNPAQFERIHQSCLENARLIGQVAHG